jgi:hypothetical protein
MPQSWHDADRAGWRHDKRQAADAEAAADSGHVPARRADGVDGHGAAESGDGLVGAAPGLGDTQILEGRGQRKLSRPSSRRVTAPGQHCRVSGEQARA